MGGNAIILEHSGLLSPRVPNPPNRSATGKKGSRGEKVFGEDHAHKEEGDTSQSSASSKTSLDTQRSIDTVSTGHDPSDDERAGDLMFWFPDDDSPPPKRRKEREENPTSIPITSRPRVLSSQHDAVVDPVVTHCLCRTKRVGKAPTCRISLLYLRPLWGPGNHQYFGGRKAVRAW